MSGGPFRPRGTPAPAEAPPEPPATGPPAPRSRGVPTAPASWVLGVVVIVVLAYITVNTITTDTPGSRGLRPGSTLPPFAAPLATGTVEGDANVLVAAREGVPRACDVRGPGVFNVCEARERGPLVLGFLAAPSRRCVGEIDALDDLARRVRGVGFAVVAVRGERADVRRLVRERGWTLPVAWDRDGAVANTYAVAVCPTVTFARRGGVVAGTTIGAAGARELARRAEALR